MIWDAVMRLLKMKESNHKPKKKRKRPKKIKLQSNSLIYWCRSLLSIVNVTHRKSKIEKKKQRCSTFNLARPCHAEIFVSFLSHSDRMNGGEVDMIGLLKMIGIL